MSTPTLPPEVTYGTVTGDLVKAIGDSDDPGTLPDAALVPGARITFTPSVPRVLFGSPIRRVVMPAPIVVPLPQDEATFTGAFSVDLVATDNEYGNPVDWTYTVKVEVPDVATWEFPISVPTDSVEDLADLLPVAASEGTLTIRGPKGDPGPPGPPGTTFDTGWRDVSGDLEAGWDGPLLVRRVGQFVCFGSTDSPLFGPGGGGAVVWIPPQGWRPVGLSALPSYFGTGAVTARPTQIDVAGGISWGPGGSYITDDPEADPQDWPGVPWEA